MFALVDCNNFFVSCERVFKPELEGRAVVVLSNNDGCVVARSNESKAMGIKMGTPFFQLKDYVKNGVLVACSSNYHLYGDLSARVMSILAEAAPRLEIYSIDEAFLHLDGIPDDKIQEFCTSLVKKIRKWVGIPVSIGVAPTKTLAKVASHFAKRYKGYKGVCIIDTEEKRRKALSLTPVDDVWGVGRRNAKKMPDLAVRTALDFAERPAVWARELFNLPGLRTWYELNGKVAVAEELGEARKTICTSRSFAEMTGDEKELVLRVSDFAAQCAKKLRSEHTAACAVTTFLMTNRFRDDLKQYFPSTTIYLPEASSSTQDIVSHALKALRIIYKPGYSYKKAGVIVSDIVPSSHIQGNFWGFDPVLREKQDKLSRIMDEVNGNGEGLLRLATQRPGHYADGIRSDYRSRLYSTSLSDVIEVH